MVMLNISEALAAKLDAYAKREGRSIEDVLEMFITESSLIPPYERNIEEQSAAMESIGGLFDDDLADLSSTVNESVQHAFGKKHDRTD